ncbi:hypothetical protein ASG83_08510 [Yonghaparkia sp. Soil809]|nr:alpha-L-arabinofuranosidase C-terminal domain-containing protein [Yonghaparkia sp. Soil809]KRF30887.1 hypothetical protein ASG83_08510 [Yonghaparkia sp. Soil809]
MTGQVVRVEIDPDAAIATVDRRLFGGFVEHMGRGVYGGIVDPEHPTADAAGFRGDVIELVRELGVTTIRYPGGNFVSGFRWEDGVGPVPSRPARLNLAWHSAEPNTFGLDEFTRWLELVGGDLMLAVNLGTRGIDAALELLEYANHPGGTALSELRRAHGRDDPYGVRMWCLGNEMDGPWQLGQMTPDEYGRIASRTAKAMRQLDPGLELVACGSSSADMPTFGKWERTVLQHAHDDVDYLSCHAYYEPIDGDLPSFLASGSAMDAFIRDVVAHADAVRDERGSSKTILLSFDEWNVWYQSRVPGTLPAGDDWPVNPPISEDDYTLADAVVVGDLLITLLGHADRVKSASLAQLVNVIAPIAAPAGAPAWRRTTFYPFSLTSRFGRGQSIPVRVASPSIETQQHGSVDAVRAAAVLDEDGVLSVFIVNRSVESAHRVELSLVGGAGALLEATTLSDRDPWAANTADDPLRVVPAANDTAVLEGGSVRIELPPVSWTLVRVDRRSTISAEGCSL